MANEISNSDDIIDSRDVIKRIEELESERDGLAEAVDDAKTAKVGLIEPTDEETDDADDEIATAERALLDWNEGDEGQELTALINLQSEAEGYAPDWHHGATLIRDSYFEKYAEELADDLGLLPKDAAWPATCIDWEKAARELQVDYTSVDFDGIDYWIR